MFQSLTRELPAGRKSSPQAGTSSLAGVANKHYRGHFAPRRISAKYIASVGILCTLVMSASPVVLAKSSSSDATSKANTPKSAVLQTMHGYVSANADMDPVATAIDDVMSKAIEKSTIHEKHNKQIKKYEGKVNKTFKMTKDAVNFILCDRGFLPSMEGMAVMLDEDTKIKSKGAAELAKQHWLDSTHDRVVADMLELATALGTEEGARRTEMINGSMASIKELAGEDTANSALQTMTAWYESVKKPTPTVEASASTIWSVKEKQKKVELVVSNCIKSDPIAEEIQKRAHKFKHKKVTAVTAQLVETSLNAVTLTPAIIGPAAQAALLVFFMATGGTEEDKLLDEMYLGKRLQSRKQSFAQQAAWAIEGYQIGILAKNQALTACSESLIKRLGGTELWTQVFNATQADSAKSASETPAAVTATSSKEVEVTH